MYLADYHIHSRISPDARTSMADLAEAAVKAGLDEVCFTDHVEPIAWGSTDLRGPYNWAAMAEEFEAAKQAVDDQEARLVAVCQVAVVPQEDGNLAKSYLWASIWQVIDKIMALIEVTLAKSAEDKIFFLTL